MGILLKALTIAMILVNLPAQLAMSNVLELEKAGDRINSDDGTNCLDCDCTGLD